jgi:2-oxoglutarate dehydrogenase complex dehydrogenase (E1) component-like enzyme
MGAWFFVRQAFEDSFQGRLPLGYVGRMTSPSPAEGSFTWHQSNQQAILAQAFQTQSPQDKEEELVVRG